MRTDKKPLLLAIFLLLSLITLLWSSKEANAYGSGSPIPSFELPTMSGKHLTNSSLQGHVSLINVWASWCGYCVNEQPVLMMIKNQYHIPIYGIDYKDDGNEAAAWLRHYGNPYTVVAFDYSGDFGDKLDVNGTPVTFVVDKKGNVRYRYTGELTRYGWENSLLPEIRKYENE